MNVEVDMDTPAKFFLMKNLMKNYCTWALTPWFLVTCLYLDASWIGAPCRWQLKMMEISLKQVKVYWLKNHMLGSLWKQCKVFFNI
jgi:hypothetical protein